MKQGNLSEVNSPKVQARYAALQAVAAGENRDQEIASQFNLEKTSMPAIRAWLAIDAGTSLKFSGLTASWDVKQLFLKIAAEYDNLKPGERKAKGAFLKRNSEALGTTPEKLNKALERFSELRLKPESTVRRSAKIASNGYNPLPAITACLREETRKAKLNHDAIRLVCKIHADYIQSILGKDNFAKVPAFLKREKQGAIFSEEAGKIFGIKRKELSDKLNAYTKVGALVKREVDGYTAYEIHPALRVYAHSQKGVIPAYLIRALKI